MKKVLVIGATGTIGKEVVNVLTTDNEVIQASKTSTNYPVDMTDEKSITALFDKVGTFDALVITAGELAFAGFSEMTTEQWHTGLNSKLMGQVNLARKATKYLTKGGSITLTSGILTEQPIAFGTAASTINGAINHFVMAAATELPNAIRINVVSPTVVTESLPVYGEFFPGFESAPVSKVANAFVKSVMGVQTGQIFEVFG